MYYFWGYIRLNNKGEEGLSVAMLSTLDPKKNISLPFKKWRFSRRAFVSPHDALSWGRRLVSRYAQLKRRRTPRALDEAAAIAAVRRDLIESTMRENYSAD